MKQVSSELRSIVKEYGQKCRDLPEASFNAKPDPARWSKKEVVGHLIDSAANNLRRFICSQYETTPPKIVYDQDFWVASNRYQQADKNDVILLWTLINRQICEVLEQMPPAHYEKLCNTGKQEPSLHTLQWLAEDYVKHLKHHLNQIIPQSFNITYP